MSDFISSISWETLGVLGTWAGVLVALAALAITIGQLGSAIYPLWQQHRSRRILSEKFSRGPYDESTIKHSTLYYVRPKCSNIDPAQEQEMRHALMATREDLFAKVDHFLDQDDSHHHLLILADSGTGKTSFVLNYYVHNARRPRRKRHTLALVPLGKDNADELIKSIPNAGETAIFLDALDEDTKAIEDHHARVVSLMKSCRDFKRVIITCRTQFFPKDQEIPVKTGIARIGPRKAGEGGIYEFWKLYLAPFDDEDVKAYIKKRYPLGQYRSRQRALEVALQIPMLSVRPMLLAHIPDLIESNASLDKAHQLYEAMIDAWLERETAWVDKQALREISELLAIDMYVNRAERGIEAVPYSQLPSLAQRWQIELESWQISGRSLLNRDAQGKFKFAHRSIMEYLFVIRLLKGDSSCYNVDLTDQMKQFLVEILGEREPNLNALRGLIMNEPVFAQQLHKKLHNEGVVAAQHGNSPGSGTFSFAKDLSEPVFADLMSSPVMPSPMSVQLSGTHIHITYTAPISDSDGVTGELEKLTSVFLRRLRVSETGSVKREHTGRMKGPSGRKIEVTQFEFEGNSAMEAIELFKYMHAHELFRSAGDGRWDLVSGTRKAIHPAVNGFVERFGVDQLRHLYHLNRSSEVKLEPVPDFSHFILRIRQPTKT